MSIGPWQIILIIALVLIFFGPSRLPGLGKSIGDAIRGFKKGISEDDERDVTAANSKESLKDSKGEAHESQKAKKKEEV